MGIYYNKTNTDLLPLNACETTTMPTGHIPFIVVSDTKIMKLHGVVDDMFNLNKTVFLFSLVLLLFGLINIIFFLLKGVFIVHPMLSFGFILAGIGLFATLLKGINEVNTP